MDETNKSNTSDIAEKPLSHKRPLTAKEHNAIEYYLNPDSDTYNQWCNSCTKAGYSDCEGKERNAHRVWIKDVVRTAIRQRRAEIQAKTDTTVELVQVLYQTAYNEAQGLKQPSAMVSAATGIARLYGMDKDAQARPDQPDTLSEQELTELRVMAKAATGLKVDTGVVAKIG